jgi:hypothetical protein
MVAGFWLGNVSVGDHVGELAVDGYYFFAAGMHTFFKHLEASLKF